MTGQNTSKESISASETKLRAIRKQGKTARTLTLHRDVGSKIPLGAESLFRAGNCFHFPHASPTRSIPVADFETWQHSAVPSRPRERPTLLLLPPLLHSLPSPRGIQGNIRDFRPGRNSRREVSTRKLRQQNGKVTEAAISGPAADLRHPEHAGHGDPPPAHLEPVWDPHRQVHLDRLPATVSHVERRNIEYLPKCCPHPVSRDETAN